MMGGDRRVVHGTDIRPSMPSCEASIEIRATTEEVFDLIHDYSRRLEWDPFLRRAEIVDGASAAGIGVKTLCVARWRNGGLGMETVYVNFHRPTVAAVKMTRGPWFLGRFAASIRQETTASGCRVTYRFSFAPWPRWAAPLFSPVFRRVFARETHRRLHSLKQFVERRVA